MKNSGLFENTMGAIEDRINNEALITMEDNIPVMINGLAHYIAELELSAKLIEAKQKEIKAKLLEEMQKHNILKLDTDELTITYIAPTTRETFDKNKFQDDFPDLYDEYVKIGTVSPSIKFKVKGA